MMTEQQAVEMVKAVKSIVAEAESDKRELQAAKETLEIRQAVLRNYESEIQRIKRLIVVQTDSVRAAHAAVVACEAAVRNQG